MADKLVSLSKYRGKPFGCNFIAANEIPTSGISLSEASALISLFFASRMAIYGTGSSSLLFSGLRLHISLDLNPDGTDRLNRHGNNIRKESRAAMANCRDILLTTMILAECTLFEVCTLTAHEEKSALTVWKHYKAECPEISIGANEKMAKYYAKHGLDT